MVPIYKEGNKEDFSNYRPISLLPVFGKVMERIIYTRMMKFIDKFKTLNDSQFGFRKKRITIDALACVVEEVRHAKFLKIPSVCVFLDLRKAFDTLDHKILFDKLHRYGFRGPIFSLLSSFLQNRSQFLQVENHKSSLRSVACGVPQGSVLGPLLFLLYINDLPDVANSNITLFADDTNIFGKVVNGNQDTLTETLSKVDNWMKSNKLKCNLDKSKAIIFNKSSESDLHLGSLVIEMKHNLKYLGVIIDDSLCFKDHVAKIKQKLNFCHHTVRRSRDLLTESQLLVYYKLHVNPLIQYGVLIYGCTSFSILSPIYTLQKKILRTMFFLEKFASVDSLMIKNELPTVHEFHVYELFKFIVASLSTGHPVQVLNDILKPVSQSDYYLRNKKHELAIEPVSFNKMYRQSLSIRVPRLYNKLKHWCVLPENDDLGNLSEDALKVLCHRFLRSYLIGNMELVRFVYKLQ